MFSFFSFYCSANHRDLHSFPTRRSSDLQTISSTLGQAGISSVASHPTNESQGVTNVVQTFGVIRIIFRLPRSEEHTSELQSRRDLVCRLLLEKKKKKKT